MGLEKGVGGGLKRCFGPKRVLEGPKKGMLGLKKALEGEPSFTLTLTYSVPSVG